MQAYHQGTIDYFCAVYAIINASRLLLNEENIRFSYERGCHFYQHLMTFLHEQGHFMTVLTSGTDYPLMDKLLKEASDYLFKHYRYRLLFSYPFHRKKTKIGDLLREVEAFFNQPRQACIMRYHNFVEGDHWNVPRIITKNTHILKFWDQVETTFHVEDLTLKPYKRDGLTHLAKRGIIYLTLEKPKRGRPAK